MVKETNVVVFRVIDAAGDESTHGDHAVEGFRGGSIKQVWKAIRRRDKLNARHVKEIYSEWEPSASDRAFLSRTFPDARVTFTFERPDHEADWPAAVERAAKVIREAQLKQRAEAADELPLLPVLRRDDDLASAMVRREFVPGLVFALGRAGLTERETIRVSYVMKNDAPDDPDGAWLEAIDNAGRGVTVQGAEEDAGRFVVIVREEGMATSLLADPEFLPRAAEWLDTPRFCVGWSDPDTVVLWPSGDAFSDTMTRRVLAHGEPDGPLDATVLRVHDGVVSVA